MKPIPCTLMACLALTLAACGKKDDSAPAAGATSTGSSAKAPSAGGVASVTVPEKEPVKEIPKEPAPVDDAVARTPGSASPSEADAAKAKAQAQADQQTPKEDPAKPGQSPAAGGTPPQVAASPPAAPAKPAELPKPFLGEGFEARAADGDDGTRAALDKLLNKAPLTTPIQAPAPAAPAPPPPQR